MPLPFHTIWLGGGPPLRVLEGLAHLLTLTPPTAAAPLLWLDRSSWDALQQQAPLRLQPCGLERIPQGLRSSTAAQFGPRPLPNQWLRLEISGGPRHLPVLRQETLNPDLAQPWSDLQPAIERLAALQESASGQTLLANLAFHDPASAPLRQPAVLLAYLQALIQHARAQWAAHGLLCLASDLLRLLALAWLPGAYGDLGDVAVRLKGLPRAADVGPDGFCAHHTVAIENDLILSTSALPLQAAVLATALWSWRHVRAIAQRLAIDQGGADPVRVLQAVLPHLDRQLPPPPPLAPLLQPPWSRLADYINVAYGAAPLFHGSAAVAPYIAGRRGKELLINAVGGFTGYQEAAFHLAPHNAVTWSRCAARLGLADYAPQLGWKTYGFGTIDRLIDLGRRLERQAAYGAATEPKLAAELALLAGQLGCTAPSLDPLARLCAQLHERLSQAHHQPHRRQHWLAQVEALCAAAP